MLFGPHMGTKHGTQKSQFEPVMVPLNKLSWGQYLSVGIDFGIGTVGQWWLEASGVDLKHRLNAAKVATLVPIWGPAQGRVRTGEPSRLNRLNRLRQSEFATALAYVVLSDKSPPPAPPRHGGRLIYLPKLPK